MGIKFHCPNGHKLHVKAFLAGKRGICPDCRANFKIPAHSGGQALPFAEPSSTAEAPRKKPHSVETAPRPCQSQSIAPAAPDDMLTASPKLVWYVRPSAGGQFGPALGDTMRQWIDDGRVAADSMVWREGWPEWQSAAKLFPDISEQPISNSADAPSPAAIVETAGVPERRKQNRSKNLLSLVLAGITLVLAGVLIFVLWKSR